MQWLFDNLHSIRDKMMSGQVLKLLPENRLVPIAIAMIVVLLTFVIYLILLPDDTPDKNLSVEDEEQDEALKKQFEDELKPIEDILCHAENYTWRQSSTEVEMFFQMEKFQDVKGKEVSVKITSNDLKISIRGECVLEGQLFAGVVSDECNWSIEQGSNKLWITMQKKVATKRGAHWPTVLK